MPRINVLENSYKVQVSESEVEQEYQDTKTCMGLIGEPSNLMGNFDEIANTFIVERNKILF